MRRAYLLIDVADGRALHVAESLRQKPDVAFADAVTGPHRVIAILQQGDAKAIVYTALEDIRAIKGVSGVTTCHAIGVQ